MGRCSSVVTPWEDITIHALDPGKVTNVTKVVKVNNHYIFQDAEGRLYCPKIMPGVYYTLGNWGWLSEVITGLVKLKVITQKQADEWKAKAVARERAQSARHDLKNLEDMAKLHGLDIPEAAYEKLRKTARIRKAAQ